MIDDPKNPMTNDEDFDLDLGDDTGLVSQKGGVSEQSVEKTTETTDKPATDYEDADSDIEERK